MKYLYLISIQNSDKDQIPGNNIQYFVNLVNCFVVDMRSLVPVLLTKFFNPF